MKAKGLFFAKAALVLVLVLVFLFGVISPQYTQGFNASVLDKVARLKAIEEPKIVLIGNSNLPFGMDTARLEEEIGMPAVNMGLHGGAGNAFHEEMAKINVQPGDIYIVCHTDYGEAGDKMDPSLVWITIENHFPLWGLVPPSEYDGMKDALSTYIKKALALWSDGSGNEGTEDAYTRAALNAYGDDVFERPQTVDGAIDFESQEVPSIGDACVTRLNALNAYLAERGATLLIAAFPIANGEHTPLVSDYEAFQEELESRMDAPVISYFPEYMYDYSYFYDTLYHLTDDGVRLRTNYLIDDLQIWLERNGD